MMCSKLLKTMIEDDFAGIIRKQIADEKQEERERQELLEMQIANTRKIVQQFLN